MNPIAFKITAVARRLESSSPTGEVTAVSLQADGDGPGGFAHLEFPDQADAVPFVIRLGQVCDVSFAFRDVAGAEGQP